MMIGVREGGRGFFTSLNWPPADVGGIKRIRGSERKKGEKEVTVTFSSHELKKYLQPRFVKKQRLNHLPLAPSS